MRDLHPLAACHLCPHRCGVNRLAGQRGRCRAPGDAVEVFRHGPHHGEEPPLSGTRGSGTVFFSRCTLTCLYCQNHPWSQAGEGRALSVENLAGILRDLHTAGCHNWNLVSPTPWWPFIAEALAQVRAEGLRLPVVCNTSGFERIETLATYGSWVDIYLPDLRYSQAATAQAASGAPGYVEAARQALLEMWRQRGPLRVDAEGVAVSGVICRILILPGHAEEAIANLRWLAETVGTEIAVSLMAQYLPAHRAPGLPPWDRPITRREYDAVCATMVELGFDEGWMQELDEATPDELIGFRMKGTQA